MSGIAVLALGQALAACGGSGSPAAPVPPAPVAPPPVAQPLPTELVVFTDPTSGFSTSDVRDVHEQIVRFNTAYELIWAADGTRFSGYRVYGQNGCSITAERICPSCSFLVRFGSQDGERRAYLTWPDGELYGRADHPPPTLLDVEIAGFELVVTDTDVVMPRS